MMAAEKTRTRQPTGGPRLYLDLPAGKSRRPGEQDLRLLRATPKGEYMRKGTFVILRGYIDESYNGRIFLLSALVGLGTEWRWLDGDWKACIDRRNAELQSRGRKPITRFHAAECNSLDGEYEGWSRGEQIEFMKALIKILGRSELDSVAFALDMDAFYKFFPDAGKLSEPDLLRELYGFMTKYLVYRLAPQYVAADPGLKIALVHDRCDYDGVMADAFRKAIEDKYFKEGSAYTSITPASSVDIRPLQMADLISHENFKEAKRKYKSGRSRMSKRRTSLKVMIKQGNFGGGIEYISVEALRKLKWILSRNRDGQSGKEN